jgi:hypothetical protein
MTKSFARKLEYLYRMKPGWCGKLALVLAGVAAVGVGANAETSGRQSVAAGIYLSRGDYGETQETTVAALPLSYKYDYGLWNLKATLSLVQISGPGNIDTGGITTSARSREENGLGDLYFRVGHFYPMRGGALWWEPYAKLKLPTANYAKGLGTGEPDLEVGTELSHRVAHSGSVFGKLGYRWRGDPPQTHLNNGVLFNMGYMHSPLPQWSGGAMFDYRAPSTDTADATQEMTVFLTRRYPQRRNVTAYLLTGLTDASPALGGGLQFTF